MLVFLYFRNSSCVKQVPLVFALMSRKRKADYTSVLIAVESYSEASPSRVILDFEVGMWEAIRDLALFATSQLQGCPFHFTQCTWRQIQDGGMRQDYINDEGTRLVRF